MGLIGNGRVIFRDIGLKSGVFAGQTGNYIKGGLRNRFAGGVSHVFGAYPSGTLAPQSFILPQKPGAIVSVVGSGFTLSPLADLIPARNLDGSSTFTLTNLDAQLDQIVSLVLSGSLSLSTTSAILVAAAQGVASGTLSIAKLDALCGAIFSVTAASNITLGDDATITAIGHMEAESGGPTPLSPEGLANAILDALLADHNDAGTVGEALNSIGASGNPWSSDLSANNNPGTFGERVQKLLTVAKFLGLK